MRILPVAISAAGLSLAACHNAGPPESPAPATFQAINAATDGLPATATLARIYYWRAHPGKIDAYTRYITDLAEPIDHEAQRRGAFLSITTIRSADTTGAWTHARIFKLRDSTQLAGLSKALDEAGIAIEPDSAKRHARSAYSATLRDAAGSATIDLANSGLAHIGYEHRDPLFPANPRVDQLFARWDTPNSPGCALGVVQNGRFVYERGYGMANLDYDIPNAPNLVYYVGSDSKQFTAAAIGLLQLRGKLNVNDDIRKYLPEMPDYRATYGVPVTIDQLIHHTSGIRDIYTLMSLAGIRLEDVMTDETALKLIASQKELNFKPGTEFLYSNSGYWLLGQIVKRVTGSSLRVFADEQIFQPLGMTHTHFHDDPGHVMKNRAMSYENAAPGNGAGAFRISYLQNFDKIGAGGLYSTVEDLQKWDENYYTHTVGGDALQALIHTRGVLANGDTIVYAFGNEVSTLNGLRTDEHGGSMMGYKAHILRFPDQRFSVLLTCNLGSINPQPLARQIAEVYLGDRMTKPAANAGPARTRSAPSAGTPISAADAGRIAGTYYSDELDATYHIVAADGGLILRRPNSGDMRLEQLTAGVYRATGKTPGDQLTLHFDSTGPSLSFTVEAGRVTNIRFRKR
jgi:CubicO group peptidase (beta-lactamase class C family)